MTRQEMLIAAVSREVEALAARVSALEREMESINCKNIRKNGTKGKDARTER